MQIHIARDGKQLGPFSLEEINRQIAAGTLSLIDNAWYEGAAGWVPLSTVPGVTGSTATSASASVPPVTSPPVTSPSVTTPSIAATGPGAPVTVVDAPTEPLAIWSLVLSLVGLLGFCCGGPVLGIAAVICGHLALAKIKANPMLQGHGMAMAGLVLGYLAIISWAFYLIFFGGLAALTGMLEAVGK